VKSVSPATASPVAASAGSTWFANQASNWSWGRAMTRMRMLAWERPQYSVHWPQ